MLHLLRNAFGRKSAHKDLTSVLLTLDFSTCSFPSIFFSFCSVLQATYRFVLTKRRFITPLSSSGTYWFPTTHHTHQIETSLQTFITLHNQICPCYTAFSRFCPANKLSTISTAAARFLSLSVITRLSSLCSFLIQQWKFFPFLFNCALLVFQDPS